MWSSERSLAEVINLGVLSTQMIFKATALTDVEHGLSVDRGLRFESQETTKDWLGECEANPEGVHSRSQW